MTQSFSRRGFLTRSALIGCSLAASPLLTPVTFAAAPWDTRLVVIVLRGGMDGIGVVQPYGDPDYAGLRKHLNGGPAHGGLDLDGFFALHPAMKRLLPIWRRGELGFVHAVSTPYRDKRSHFDGQDLLEAGTETLTGARAGWLNRMLQEIPGTNARTAFALGNGDMKILNGAAPVSNWSPDANLVMSAQAERLAHLVMEDDPLFQVALEEALSLSRSDDPELQLTDNLLEDGDADMQMSIPARARGEAHVNIAEFAASQLKQDARVASFSINGWDTHNRQKPVLAKALGQLTETILTLEKGLGPKVWSKTAIVAMTEFGRTVRENGTAGTDHGTGGAMVLAGGAVRGGRVHGRWPGLSEADLYARRDLMPTADLRAQTAWILAGLTGLDRHVLETVVFPGMQMESDPALLR
ncbi:MAG: DUF1501 domain-containing protein [Rhodobacteraceae bacterium]|nr:DUF1501 domain-containing protein [Paracoccaceae bacterium]